MMGGVPILSLGGGVVFIVRRRRLRAPHPHVTLRAVQASAGPLVEGERRLGRLPLAVIGKAPGPLRVKKVKSDQMKRCSAAA